MKRPLLFLLAAPLFGHMVSMSTGDAVLAGSRLDYELRIPLYEVAHVRDAEAALFANIHFYGGGDEARVLKKSCREEQGNLVCNAMYLFPRDVEDFKARCTFAAITVPNHVHLLRAVSQGKNDSAAFDISFTEADLRFRPPTFAETFARESGAGFWRAIAGPAQVLFLIALLLAAGTLRELAALVGMFAVGQVIAALFAKPLIVELSPRFLEAAAALTIAYFAVELLLLPNAGGRWVVVGVLGLFHGIYFSQLIEGGGYRPGFYLAGAVSAEALLAALMWAVTRVVRPRVSFQFQRTFASLLLVIGIGWFLLRMKN